MCFTSPPKTRRIEPICLACYEENIPKIDWGWDYKFKKFPEKYKINSTLEERLYGHTS